MLSPYQLKELGLDINPAHNSFTYTYPPPYIAKKLGREGRPKSVENFSSWTDISLYFHIPFCRIDCDFCSLHRQVVRNEEIIEVYLESIINEIHLYKSKFKNTQVTSIFFGGGTPTILTSIQINKILDEIATTFILAQDVELCMEFAPDINRTDKDWIIYLQTLVTRDILPLNRVSFGVQSFDEKILQRMGRQGGIKAIENLLNAVESIVPLYNIDIILGYPEVGENITTEQNVTLILEKVSNLLMKGFRLPSISLYQLWDTESIRLMYGKAINLPNEDTLLNEKFRLQSGLFDLGYSPSVVSSFIRDPGNSHKWAKHRHLNFRHLGIGSGAYSIFPSELIIRKRDINGYIEAMRKDPQTHQLDICYELSKNDQIFRELIMGLRSYTWIKEPTHYLTDNQAETDFILEQLSQKIERLINIGLIERKDNLIKLSNQSFIIANEISAFLHPSEYPRKK